MSGSADKWLIEGEYFESCNCTVLCPCLLTHAQARPTEGHCDVVLAVQVAKGHYGKVDLSGLNAVQAIRTPGPMAQGGGTLAVYLDSRASDEQRAALEKIFTGNAGGPPALLAGLISTRLPVKSAAITFESKEKVRKLSIPGIGEVAVEGITGAGDKVVWLENVAHPFSTRLAAAKGTASHFRDHSFDFENSGRNGHFAPIQWSSQ